MEKKSEKKVKRFYEPECPREVPKYEWRVDEEGHHYLFEIGKYCLDDEIQLYKDSCDIKILVDRMKNGDPATIKQLAANMLYGDVNDYPEEVHPAAYAQGLKNLYDNQPQAVKDKFPTYELFAKYFTNLTEAMINEMYAPKQESEEKVNE